MKSYRFADIKHIIDLICCKKIPLKYIGLYGLVSLTGLFLIKLSKLNNGNEILIQVEACGINNKDKAAVFSYIRENNLVFKY